MDQEARQETGSQVSGTDRRDRDGRAQATQTLADLIAKLEQAGEGSVDLDYEIEMVVHPDGLIALNHKLAGDAPFYTTSLDAALQLAMQDNYLPQMEADDKWSWGGVFWQVMLAHYDYDATDWVYHRSLPIALCIARLRAMNAS